MEFMILNDPFSCQVQMCKTEQKLMQWDEDYASSIIEYSPTQQLWF